MGKTKGYTSTYFSSQNGNHLVIKIEHPGDLPSFKNWGRITKAFSVTTSLQPQKAKQFFKSLSSFERGLHIIKCVSYNRSWKSLMWTQHWQRFDNVRTWFEDASSQTHFPLNIISSKGNKKWISPCNWSLNYFWVLNFHPTWHCLIIFYRITSFSFLIFTFSMFHGLSLSSAFQSMHIIPSVAHWYHHIWLYLCIYSFSINIHHLYFLRWSHARPAARPFHSRGG